MFLANTYKQDLMEHNFGVGILALEIFRSFYSKEKYNLLLDELYIERDNKDFKIESLEHILLNMAFYHDIGKIDVKFQNFLNVKLKINNNYSEDEQYEVQIEPTDSDKKFSVNDYPLHQEISWAIASSFKKIDNLRIYHKNLFLYGIYWHHAKTLRDKNDTFSNAAKIFEKINTTDLLKNVKNYNKEMEFLIEKYGLNNINLFLNPEFDELSEIKGNSLSCNIPLFQSSSFLSQHDESNDLVEFLKNSLMHLFRSILITSDRIISSLSEKNLKEHIQEKTLHTLIYSIPNEEYENVNVGIKSMLEKFNNKYGKSERSLQQEKVAEELSAVDDTAILYGPAGVGKTKIMLDWIQRINNKKKIFIIVPKTSIAFSLYEEIRTEYLPGNSVEIITGDMKKISHQNQEKDNSEGVYFQSEINITTIDQILGMMLSHNKIDVFLEVLNSNLIFDEYHEFLDTPGMIMLFIQIIYLKRFSKNNKTLLVSATPNYFLLKEKLKINVDKNLKQIKSFNETSYKIEYEKFFDTLSITEINNKMFSPVKNSEIVLFNSATKSQVSAIKAMKMGEQNTLVYHSKFTVSDRKKIFNTIMKEFGKKTPTRNNTLRVGPILQASIDISTNHMYTEISTIDNIFQRLGRVVRWGESDKGYYTIFIPEDIEKGSIKKSLSNINNYNSTVVFIDFIYSKISSGSEWKLNDLYPLYKEFFNLPTTKAAYEKDWLLIRENSRKVFDQNFEPVKFLIKNNTKSKNKVLSKKSLRGKSIFAIACDLDYDGYKQTITELNTKDFQDHLFSIEKSSFNGEIEKSNTLEENREQIAKYYSKNYTLSAIEKEIKSKSYIGKKDLSKVPSHWFLDFARNEKTPLILSFSTTLMKMDSDEERFNLTYRKVKIGIINYKLFNKVK